MWVTYRTLTSLVLFCAVGTVSSTCNDRTQGYPATSPPWPICRPNYPWPLLPRAYSEQTDKVWTQNYTCTNGTYHGKTFNLIYDPQCETHDATDYYGWGVRLGFYFNWVASFVANNFLPDEIPGVTDANAIFLFALGISIARGTVVRDFRKVDAVVMTLLSTGTTVGTMSLWGYRSCRYRLDGRKALRFYGGIGTHFRLTLCVVIDAYWIWFWYNPFIHQLGVETCDPRCAAAWIFGHPVSSGIRGLLLTFSALLMLYWMVNLPGAFVIVFNRALKGWQLRKQAKERSDDAPYAETTKVALQTGLSEKQLANWSYVWGSLNLLWFVFIIALIEKTVHENNVQAAWVTSSENATPGQLIPFLIGLVTTWRMFYILHETRRYSASIEPTLPEEGPTEIGPTCVGGQDVVEEGKASTSMTQTSPLIYTSPNNITKPNSPTTTHSTLDKVIALVRKIWSPVAKRFVWLDRASLMFSPGYNRYVALSPQSKASDVTTLNLNEPDFRGWGWIKGSLHWLMPWLVLVGNPPKKPLRSS